MNDKEPLATNDLVVSFLLRKENEAGLDRLTPLKINKLVYFCHGCTLGYYDRPLIENRHGNIQAWKYGPVVVDIYHKLKRFGRSPVTLDEFCSSLTIIPFSNRKKKMIETLNTFSQEHSDVYSLLEWVYDYFKDWKYSKLKHLNHLPSTPWRQSYTSVRKDTPIPDALIKIYYDDIFVKEEK